MSRLIFACFLSIGTLAAACGPAPRESEAVCASEDEEAVPTQCGDDCVDLLTDPRNCGSCGNVCGTGTNGCVDGLCVCANADRTVVSKDPCDFPSVCDETGWCLIPDRTGAACDEIDNVPCKRPDGSLDPTRVCVNGYCTVPDCDGPEICNLLDDDCDGLADQSMPGQPLSQSCYSGPNGTSGVGICRGGTQLCVAGGWTPCNGEQTPVNESGFLRCDGLDNDCDACADNTLNDQGMCEPLPPLKADIVFIIDRSGSMGGVIAAVVSAVQSWATSIGTNPNIRFALVDPTDPGDPDGVSVTQGLTGYMAFNAVMAGVSANGNGTEPMHYATQLVLGGAFDAQIGWAPDSIRIVIAIHDEPTTDATWPSGNTVPGYDESSVCGAVPANTILAVITDPQWFPEWDLCTSSGAMPATAMPLSSDPTAMLNNLNLIIETPCF